MSVEAVTALRQFNRTFTTRLGVLDESFLGTGRPLAVSRLLFEIGLGPVTVHELRRRLDADSGYVSRMLRRLEDDELIELTDDPADGRRRVATLTRAGTDAWNDLDQRSDDIARKLLDPLTSGQRGELSDALTRAQRLLRVASISLREVAPDGDAAMSAMRAYVDELDRRFPERFDIGTGFDPPELAEMASPTGTFVVVEEDGEALGCGGLRRLDDDTAEVKRMWLHPSLRGLGVGRRILGHLESAAAELGYSTVMLDTHATLETAAAMYASAGYERVDRYNDNPYGQLFFRKELA